jgi:hypothetical protein
LLSLLGRISYAAVACPYVIFFRTSLISCAGSGDLNEVVSLTPTAMDELRFWCSADAKNWLSYDWEWSRFSSNRVFAKHRGPEVAPLLTLWGDASEYGAGFNASRDVGLPDSELLPPEFSGNEVPSIVRELYVITRLVELARVPRGSTLRLVSDNQGAVATANGSAVCASTAPIARRLVSALLRSNVRLHVEWAPREELTDVDARSRWDSHDLSHCMCTLQDYQTLFTWAFGPHRQADVQLFSCAGSAIPGVKSCTRFPEPASLGCPFRLVWTTAGNLWAFPPFSLTRPFLRRLLHEAYSASHRSLSICALLPLSSVTSLAISALPQGWRIRQGPEFLLPPPRFTTRVRPPTPLVLIASPPRSREEPDH